MKVTTSAPVAPASPKLPALYRHRTTRAIHLVKETPRNPWVVPPIEPPSNYVAILLFQNGLAGVPVGEIRNLHDLDEFEPYVGAVTLENEA